MNLTNKQYDFLKWVLLTVEPALISLISGLGLVFGWNTEVIVTVIGLVSVFIGTITGISSTNYKKKKATK